MKKLILSGAALLITAASFAQNVVTTTQTGTANSVSATQGGSALTATISQVGSVSGNTNNVGSTIQSGNGHTATVTQDGASTFNRGAIEQKNLVTGTGSNSATISQSNGSGGSGMRSGVPTAVVAGTEGNWAGVSQEGSANKATITADGPNPTKANFAETWQKGSGNTATTNQNGAVANVTQIFQGDEKRGGGPVEGPTSVAVTGNTADIQQAYTSYNTVTVKQFSDNNRATVQQGGDPNAFYIANNSRNSAFIQQGATGAGAAVAGGNNALIQQGGQTNQRNKATILQNGTTGYGEILQVNSSNDNISYVEQISGVGSNGRIRGIGSSNGNKATVTQTGDRHIALIELGNSTTNEATINQGKVAFLSSDNNAYIGQSSGALSNSATINQNQASAGGSNRATLVQTGVTKFNVGTITQENSSNQADLKQTGVGSNIAVLSQMGDFNVISGLTAGSPALQDGSGNKMNVTQTAATGAGTSATHNTAMLGQMGTDNIINLTQTLTSGAAAGNMTTISQNGMSNVATVTQTNGMTN